jgi:hypothetical protein
MGLTNTQAEHVSPVLATWSICSKIESPFRLFVLYVFFKKHTLCGSSLRFQPSRHFTKFPSQERQKASIMHFKCQIPGQATRGFSVMSAEVLAQNIAKGR